MHLTVATFCHPAPLTRPPPAAAQAHRSSPDSGIPDEFVRLLDRRLTGRVALLGLGNPAHRDEGAGIELARRVATRIPSPHRTWLAGSTPERVLRELREERFQTVVLLDAVEFDAPAGSVAWFGAADLESRFPTDSTDKLPLSMVARLIQDGVRTEVSLIAIQPASVRPGQGLSEAVAEAVESLETLLVQALTVRKARHSPLHRRPGQL